MHVCIDACMEMSISLQNKMVYICSDNVKVYALEVDSVSICTDC